MDSKNVVRLGIINTDMYSLHSLLFISGDLIGVKGEAVHFYGNAGVCVFKYLVKKSDPQRAFSLSILILNLFCFLLITSSYVLIHKQSRGGSGQSAQKNTQARKLQAKIAFIIFTDFLAWVPFTIICILHFAELIDATAWYPFFSVIILPLNSVINPILYHSALFNFMITPVMYLYDKASSSGRWLTARLTQSELFQPNTDETVQDTRL